MPESTSSQAPTNGFDPVAGLLALLLPGLGHAIQGQVRRGVLVGVGVLGLFFSGLFIGGIDSVDQKEDPLWFIAQAPVGVMAFGVNHVHQSFYKGTDPNRNGMRRTLFPGESLDANGRIVQGGNPPMQRSLARVHEMGILLTAVAGLLNVIAIIDALFPPRRRPGRTA